MRIQTNEQIHSSDEYFVHEALRLAEANMGYTAPNPPVGAVLVREGRIIGRGAHLKLGDLHAEAQALRDAGDAQGATCYVSLEPCSHVGRQPSCCNLLAEAGVSRVVWGCDDADPRSAGRAATVLGAQGIETRSGVLADSCAAFLRHYLLSEQQQRCFVHLKLALSLDAQLACANGASQWLSGPQSLGLAHYLRWKYDAVLVGRGTVLADNPRLTVRPEVLEPYYQGAAARIFRQPVRLVLDPSFELLPQFSQNPARFSLLDLQGQRDDLPGLIVIGRADALPAEHNLPPQVQLMGLGLDSAGRLDLRQMRVMLFERGLRSLLIEGGGAVARSVLLQQAADRLTLVYTPVLIGSDGQGFSPALGSRSIAECPRLTDVDVEVLGQDCAYSGRPQWPGTAG